MTRLWWIEDDGALRRLYRGVLEAEGFSLTELADADAARTALAAQTQRLVLLDLMLPIRA